MLDAKTRETMTRNELISHHMRRLALIADPVNGHLSKLADHIEVHATTISAWIAQGYVPWFQCKKIQKRFGRKLVPLDELCPEEFRSA